MASARDVDFVLEDGVGEKRANRSLDRFQGDVYFPEGGNPKHSRVNISVEFSRRSGRPPSNRSVERSIEPGLQGFKLGVQANVDVLDISNAGVVTCNPLASTVVPIFLDLASSRESRRNGGLKAANSVLNGRNRVLDH